MRVYLREFSQKWRVINIKNQIGRNIISYYTHKITKKKKKEKPAKQIMACTIQLIFLKILFDYLGPTCICLPLSLNVWNYSIYSQMRYWQALPVIIQSFER